MRARKASLCLRGDLEAFDAADIGQLSQRLHGFLELVCVLDFEAEHQLAAGGAALFGQAADEDFFTSENVCDVFHQVHGFMRVYQHINGVA